MLQSKTFPYCEIIFQLLDDPSARTSVKKGLQVSKFSLFYLPASPLWWGQPHSKELNWIRLTVAGKKFWPPVLLLAGGISVSLTHVLHALHLLRWFDLWTTLVLTVQRMKQLCSVGSLNILSWTPESDLKLAKSLRPPAERYFTIQLALT